MSKYIIKWDAGYGETVDVIEADSYDAALEEAYNAWKEDAECNADYEALEFNEENCEEYGIDFEDN